MPSCTFHLVHLVNGIKYRSSAQLDELKFLLARLVANSLGKNEHSV